MRNPLAHLLLIALVLFRGSAFGTEHPELTAFPVAKDGMERFVIVLPPVERDQEDSFKVEIVVGKEMFTDGVNLVRLGNIIEPHSLSGWGYTYYEVTEGAEMMSTMMAPPEGTPMVKQFVTAPPLQVPYNSRLPIIVYAPTGHEVQYRIWKASEKFRKAKKR